MSKDSIAESIKEAVQERLSSPLWGYIILSWCGFNWKNLAIMFMSKSSVNTRIEQVTSLGWHLYAPVLVGFILAAISPYIRLGFSLLHGWAKDWHRVANNAFLLKEYNATIAMADKRAEVERADELAREKASLKIAIFTERTKRESLNTQRFKQEQDGLILAISKLEKEMSELKVKRGELYQQIDSMVINAVTITDLIVKAVTGESDIEDIKAEIARTINPTLISEALDRLIATEANDDLVNK